MARSIERVLRLRQSRVRRVESRIGRVHLLLPLIEQFGCRVSLLLEKSRPAELLRRKLGGGLLLLDIGARLLDRVLRLHHLRFGCGERLSEILRIHAGQHLALRHPVALVDEELRDAPRELGGNVDLVRLDAAIAGGYAWQHSALRVLPPINAAPAQSRKQNKKDSEPDSTPRSPPSCL